MPLAVPLALLLLAALVLAIGIARANELFCVRVQGRHVRLLRGRLPQRLLDDIVDVLRAQHIHRATVRAVVEDRRPRVYVDGDISPEQSQRLRNVVSMWPLAKIRNAPPRR
ncbi:DUF3634 family protein [Chondromyces crocatus]|uniref:Uncharacterized protein n=1 Tax=Chondromyces crocatus TaxID=52 RepID=A0A0K1E8F2_CHOCO|nr:uncharacterized protein CMC5_010880 [Chondromyces crocatus]